MLTSTEKARRNPAGGDVPTAAAESDVIPTSHGHDGSVAAGLPARTL